MLAIKDIMGDSLEVNFIPRTVGVGEGLIITVYRKHTETTTILVPEQIKELVNYLQQGLNEMVNGTE